MSDATDTTAETADKPKRGRPKGLGRVPGSGRAKGTPNKKTAEIRELLLSLKCDPIQGMARIAMNLKNPAELRGRMFAELAQYQWAKRKAIEHTGDPAEPISHIIRQILQPKPHDAAGNPIPIPEKPAEAVADSPVVPEPAVADPAAEPEISRPDPPPTPRTARDKLSDRLDEVDCQTPGPLTDMETVMRRSRRR